MLAKRCVIEGRSAWDCFSLFPNRSDASVISKFNETRVKLGLHEPGSGRTARKRGDGRAPKTYTRDADPLLRRQLETGQHFIRDRAQFAAVCASVGLAA